MHGGERFPSWALRSYRLAVSIAAGVDKPAAAENLIVLSAEMGRGLRHVSCVRPIELLVVDRSRPHHPSLGQPFSSR